MRTLADRARDQISIRDFLPAAACDGATDDSPSLYAATLAMAGTDRVIAVPGDCRLNIGPAARLAGHRLVLDGTGLVGEGGRDSGQGAQYGMRGSTILLTDAGGPAFIAKRNWSLRRLIFYWPGQTEAAATANGSMPITMPALVSSSSAVGLPASEATSGEFADNDVVNAWDVMDFSADVSGGLRIHGNRVFMLDNFLRLGTMPLESWVRHNDFTPNPYQSAVLVGPTFNLRNWAADHASIVQAVGNGSGGGTVDGLQIESNYEFGLGYGLRAVGGTFNLLSGSNNGFDGVGRILSVETGGGIVGGSSLKGGMWYPYSLSGVSVPGAAVTVSADSRSGSSLTIADVDLPSAPAGLVDWRGPLGTLVVRGVEASSLNNDKASGPVSGIRIDSQGGRLTVSGSLLTLGGATPGPCVDIINPLQFLSVTASRFVSCGSVVSLGGSFGTPGIVAGNLSVATIGTTAYAGALGYTLNDSDNQWDKPSPGWSTSTRGADGALLFSFQGATKLSLNPTTGALKTVGTITGSTTP